MLQFGKGHNIGLLVLCGIFLFGVCATAAEPELTPLGQIQWGAEIDGLKLGLAISKNHPNRSKDHVFVDVFLMNTRQEAVCVDIYSEMFTYAFTVKDSDGNSVPPTEFGARAIHNRDTGFRFKQRWTQIQPGERTVATLDADYYFACWWTV